MEEREPQNSYVLCIDDGGYPESLEVRKVHVALATSRQPCEITFESLMRVVKTTYISSKPFRLRRHSS